jgi:hypothetical protein
MMTLSPMEPNVSNIFHPRHKSIQDCKWREERWVQLIEEIYFGFKSSEWVLHSSVERIHRQSRVAVDGLLQLAESC